MIAMRHFPALAALLPLGLWAQGGIRMASPFGEHMVLQQGVPVPIWGTGCPGGENVAVSIAGQNASARCDWSGKWIVYLAPMKGGGPYQLLIHIGATRVIPSPAATSRAAWS
jgi:hypothetical protein